MREIIPVGIIVQTDVKPNSKYKIAGTGIIKKWEEGYYFINIFDNKGEIQWIILIKIKDHLI